MATLLAFDKVNKLGDAGKRRSMPYEQYYGEMHLTEAQIRRRIALAEDIEFAVLFLFAMYQFAAYYNSPVDKHTAEERFTEMLREALAENNIPADVAESYLLDIATEELRVTADRYLEDEYWTSDDRARYIAEEDSNTVWNNEEYNQAIESGMSKKQWRSMKDERVRTTHREVDDTEIPINEPFVVGNSLMMYPRDMSLGADSSEIVNCRCSVVYS